MFSKATSPKEKVFLENERQRPPFNGSFSQVSSIANGASFQVPAVKEFFNVSDPDTSGISRSCVEALIAEDPEFQKSIRGLEAMLRVRASLGSGRRSPLVSVTKVVIDPVLKKKTGASAGVVENDLYLKSVNGENHPVLKQENGVVAGVVENDSVPALLECAEVRAQKRCIDSGTGDARRATDAEGQVCLREFMTVSRLSRLVRHPMHVSHTLMRCLLLLLPQMPFAPLAHLLLLVCACMMMTHPCMLHTIRGRTRFRVPREGGVPKVGFPVRSKICVLSQRWRQG